MIEIHDKDSSYIQLKFNNEDEYRTILNQFTIKIPGAEFMPSVRSGLADGTIKFINVKNQMMFGLKNKLINTCKSNDIEYKDYTKSLENEVDINEFKEFIDNISKEVHFTPFKHQIKLAYNCIKNQRGVGLAATSSGKSFSLYLIIRWYLWKGLNVFMIVPSIDLVTQMKGDILDYYNTRVQELKEEINNEKDFIKKAELEAILKGIFNFRKETNSLDLEDKISMIYGGQDKYQNKPITISTFQSLDIANNRVQEDYFHNVDVLLIDETHRASSSTLNDIIKATINAKVRYGVSGSLDEDMINNLKIEGLLGEVTKVVSFSELAELGLVTPTYIQPILLEYDKETCKTIKKMTYAEQDKFLRNHPNRNKFLARLASSFPDENVLAIAKNIDAVDELSTITANSKENGFINNSKDLKKLQKLNELNVYLTKSNTKPKDRETFKQTLEESIGNIYYAIDKVIATGVSIKRLSRIIFTNIGKSTILIQQAIGRGARKHKLKDKTVIYDIVDKAIYYSRTGKDYPNKHYQHFLERMDIYYQHDYVVLEPKTIKIKAEEGLF